MDYHYENAEPKAAERDDFPQPDPITPRYYALFDHMANEHGLTLLESELEEIIAVVDKMRNEFVTAEMNGLPDGAVNASRNTALRPVDPQSPLTCESQWPKK